MARESEKEMVDRAIDGDRQAFEEIVRAFAPKLMRFLSLTIKDHGLLEDVVQETLMRVHQGIGGLREAAGFRAWLWNIGRHVASDSLRRERAGRADLLVHTGLVDYDFGPADGLPSDLWLVYLDIMKRVDDEVRSLPDPAGRLIHMRYLEGLSYEEMGEELNLSYNQVKSRLARARIRLKAKLSDLPLEWKHLLDALSG